MCVCTCNNIHREDCGTPGGDVIVIHNTHTHTNDSFSLSHTTHTFHPTSNNASFVCVTGSVFILKRQGI